MEKQNCSQEIMLGELDITIQNDGYGTLIYNTK